MDQPTEKNCPKCSATKPLTEFHRNKRSRTGFQVYCKACQANIQRDYRARNPDKMRELSREAMRRRRAADPEREREYMRRWRAENPELVKASKRAWDEANYEKLREFANRANRRWKASNAEKVIAYNTQWAKDNPDLVAAKAKRWRQSHPEVTRAAKSRRRAMIRGSMIGPVDLMALWEQQDGLCALCGLPIDRDLKWPDPFSASVDHIIPLAKGGPHTQENLQWVHVRENWIKSDRLPEAL